MFSPYLCHVNIWSSLVHHRAVSSAPGGGVADATRYWQLNTEAAQARVLYAAVRTLIFHMD